MTNVEPTGRILPESTEHAMLHALGERLGVQLSSRTLAVPGGLRVEVEGIDAAASVLVQLVANTGAPKSSHRNKAIADMLKLVWLRGVLPTRPRLVICISEPLARFFTPASWPSAAAADMQVDVYIYRPHAPLELLTR
jgi:hypothetical protein